MVPNRRQPHDPYQSPPIFDRSQMHPLQNQGGYPPAERVPIDPYQGYGIANMFQRFGKQFDVGSSIPTGGFGFSGQQQAALAPLMQQIPQLVATAGRPRNEGDLRGPGPFHLDTSGGILGALRSIGVDTGDQKPLGLSDQQRQQFLHSLQQMLTGLQNRRPPNRGPAPEPPPVTNRGY